jgi:hypothetical protein
VDVLATTAILKLKEAADYRKSKAVIPKTI